jgi:flagellar biosynthesis protein FliP
MAACKPLRRPRDRTALRRLDGCLKCPILGSARARQGTTNDSHDAAERPTIQVVVDLAIFIVLAEPRMHLEPPVMQKNVRAKDLALFSDLSREPRPATIEELSLRILVPAFMISELKRAFEIGFCCSCRC